MNIFALSGLLTLITSGAMAFLMFFKGKHLLHYIWGLFCVSVAMWGIGVYKIASTIDPSEALWWWKIAYTGVIFIPVLFTHFTFSFLQIGRKWFITLVYFFGFLFVACDLFTDLFMKDVRLVFGEFYYISPPTALYSLFFSFFIGLVVFNHIKLWKAYKKSTGVQKIQIKYLFIGTFISFSGGSLSYLPVYSIDLYPFMNLTVSALAPIVGYAVFKYRLMDLRVVIRNTVSYIFMAAFVYGIFYFITWIYNISFGGVHTKTAYLSGLIIAPLFVALFVWFSARVKKIANKYLFISLYNSQETIEKLTDELTNSIDLNEIINSITGSIKHAMQLERAGILVIDRSKEKIKYKIAKVIGFNESNGISLVEDNFLTQYLEKTQKPLVREELQAVAKDSNDPFERQRFFQLSENMKHIEASLCLPMIISNKLIGIIVLGGKISGDAYTKEDLDLLSTLCKQAAIAVNNAKLYKEIQDFNKNLQKKVDEQTGEIRRAYEVEKMAHEELKNLDESKTNFMLITQHHLRTPLSVNIGFIELLLNGTYGKVPKKAVEILKESEKSIRQEIQMVNEMLSVSEFQMGKGSRSFFEKGISIKEILQEIAGYLKMETERKGIYLKLQAPSDLPKISADKNKIKMALTNIVDNTVKYTEKGGVEIKLENMGKIAQITVKDTGIGMSNEEKSNLFKDAFNRGREAWSANSTGKGIGLYLSAKIIQAHKGKIWAESEGNGRGSVFFVRLPVDQDLVK